MLISYREAFLGQRQLPPSKKGSGWIVIKDYGDDEWSQEFCDIKNILTDEDIILGDHAFLYESDNELCIRIDCQDNMDPTRSRDKFYYNTNTGFIFYFTRDEYYNMLKGSVDAVLAYLDSSPLSSNEDISMDQVL